MQRAGAALLIASACAVSVPPLRSTVTVTRTRNVVLVTDDLNADVVRTCSKLCADEECVAACPTAVSGPGACTAPDTTHSICRTFVDQQTFERGGGCKAEDTLDPGSVRTACVDNVAERKKAARATKGNANRIAGYILLPVGVIVIILVVI